VKEYTSHALCRVELQYIVSTQLWLPWTLCMHQKEIKSRTRTCVHAYAWPGVPGGPTVYYILSPKKGTKIGCENSDTASQQPCNEAYMACCCIVY
jgi:hypothetical protein